VQHTVGGACVVSRRTSPPGRRGAGERGAAPGQHRSVVRRVDTRGPSGRLPVGGRRPGPRHPTSPRAPRQLTARGAFRKINQRWANSWGGSEFSRETSAAYNGHFNQAHVAITASTGDSGYGVEFPAASQYVTPRAPVRGGVERRRQRLLRRRPQAHLADDCRHLQEAADWRTSRQWATPVPASMSMTATVHRQRLLVVRRPTVGAASASSAAVHGIRREPLFLGRPVGSVEVHHDSGRRPPQGDAGEVPAAAVLEFDVHRHRRPVVGWWHRHRPDDLPGEEAIRYPRPSVTRRWGHLDHLADSSARGRGPGAVPVM
jgi:hypothetical protein